MAYEGAPASDVVSDLQTYGRHIFQEPVDVRASEALLGAIREARDFDGALFLDEDAFLADPHYTGVNPRPGRNLLDRFEDRLGFVERAPMIVDAARALLGADYEILNRKIVCGVPQSVMPAWLKAKLDGHLVNNLGPYVRPEYRDVTYFSGIDFHQDLIDYKDRDADFVTLYIYLHPVTSSDAPLFLLDGSHRLGATVFPHALQPTGADVWRYGDRVGGEVEVRQRVLTGATGYVALWHACTLHGTQPDAADHERISLRYLLAKRAGAEGAGLDAVNRTLLGPTRLSTTRLDLKSDGAALLKGNTVNQAATPAARTPPPKGPA